MLLCGYREFVMRVVSVPSGAISSSHMSSVIGLAFQGSEHAP
jgi:hypothetical protein